MAGRAKTTKQRSRAKTSRQRSSLKTTTKRSPTRTINRRGRARTPPWFVYVVRCADGTLYTGIASDVERRIAEHLKTNGKGSKYLRGRGPLELVFVQGCESRGAALSLESRKKKLSKAEKEEVIQCGEFQHKTLG